MKIIHISDSTRNEIGQHAWGAVLIDRNGAFQHIGANVFDELILFLFRKPAEVLMLPQIVLDQLKLHPHQRIAVSCPHHAIAQNHADPIFCHVLQRIGLQRLIRGIQRRMLIFVHTFRHRRRNFVFSHCIILHIFDPGSDTGVRFFKLIDGG